MRPMNINVATKLNSDAQVKIEIDCAANNKALERLYDEGFGPGRYAKAAHIIRQNNLCMYNVSRVAVAHIENKQTIIGGCRIWPIQDDSGQKAVFLGPIIVDAKFQKFGLGAALVKEVLKSCKENNLDTVLLVGDIGFFGQFGFVTVAESQIKFPASVANGRILYFSTKNELQLSGNICAPPMPHK